MYGSAWYTLSWHYVHVRVVVSLSSLPLPDHACRMTGSREEKDVERQEEELKERHTDSARELLAG